MNKRTVHCIHFSSQPGGIEVLIPEIVNNMEKYDFRSFVIRPPKPGKVNVYDGRSIPVTYGDFSNSKALFKFWSYIRSNKNDIFHLYNAGPFYTLLLRLAGAKKVIFSIHGTIYWKTVRDKIIRKTIWKLAFNEKIIILANSAYSKTRFVNATGYKGIVDVVYNPIDEKRYFSAKKENSDSCRKIIYCGRLEPGKNLFTWLDLAKAIGNQIPDCIFELYGQGSLLPKLKQYSEGLGIDDKVTFCGFRKDIENAYREADWMIFLSEYESFGNVVVESFLCGTPVIASAIPSMKEIFRNFPDFLVELDENLEQNVLQKLNDQERLKALIPEVIRDFQQRFSLQQHIQKLDAIYKSLTIP